MTPGELLHSIRPQWLERVSGHLARADRVRETFRQQLTVFYEALIRAVETGNPALLTPVLESWGEARTQTELENPHSSLPLVVNQILVATFQLLRDELADSDALSLMAVILPVYSYALEQTSVLETQLHVRHVSQELDHARSLLERLEKSKSDFIAVAAHELKTPLTLIEGYASMMSESVPEDPLDPMEDMYLKGIHSGTRRLREIVDDMIDVSMIDNNLLSLNFQPLWLNRLLETVQREVAATVAERKLNLKFRAFAGVDEMTYGDGERLLQAFRNLITNAIKYTPDGGSVTIDGRMLPGFIEITFSDTGIGIDPEFHAAIFEKFGRLGDVLTHSSGKTKFKGGGPGLGLPITKGIIEAHGGTIWVESPGYDEKRYPGSTFHILLPLRKGPPDDKTDKLFNPTVDAKKVARF
ncbi:MAG: sensor histidine kinase [Chloroflexota bacterium]